MTSSGKNGLNIRKMQVPNGTGPGVRRSKRPLLASRTRCNVLENNYPQPIIKFLKQSWFCTPFRTCLCSNFWDQITRTCQSLLDISPWIPLGTFSILLSGIQLSICRFFSVAFLYIVGGIVLQKGVRGASGKEVIPNSNFWLALPGLIKVMCNIYFQSSYVYYSHYNLHRKS